MSFIPWLIFLCHMQWGEFRFMYKLCGENQCSRRNLGHVFPFVSHTYSAFKFFMWTQQFWNPKLPDMGWIGEFYRRCDKENPAWFGSIFTLIEATDPPKPLFIANGQARKCIQKLLLCLCGNLYNFSHFFLLSVCLLREFYAPVDQFEVWARLQDICPLENCAQTQSWGALAPALLQLQSLSLCQCLPTRSSALLQASLYQDFCQWTLFSTRTNLCSSDKATSGSLSDLWQRICCSAYYKKFCQQTF